jgi:hypothetical protein
VRKWLEFRSKENESTEYLRSKVVT